MVCLFKQVTREPDSGVALISVAGLISGTGIS